jgi:Uma2 family endonuclease
MPGSTTLHQSLAGNLYYLLQQQCPDELDVTQRVEVRIDKRRGLVPDVLVATLAAVARDGDSLAPDEVLLVIEVVGPGSDPTDRVVNPALYAKAGIPSFWRVDTENDEIVIEAYRLDDTGEMYVPAGRFADIVKVDRPWPIRLHVADITPRWRKPAS